jgi:hypothetical protein
MSATDDMQCAIILRTSDTREIDVALALRNEIAALADRVDDAAQIMSNRGRLLKVSWLLRTDVLDQVSLFIGERVQMSHDEATKGKE